MAQAAGGGKQQVPGVPDYMGAANQMGQASMYNTQYQTYANRPNMTTPFGSVEWTPPAYSPPPGSPGTGAGTGGAPTTPVYSQEDWTRAQMGDKEALARVQAAVKGAQSADTAAGYTEPGQWSMNLQLSPEQQAALDAQNRLGAARSGLGETLFGRAQTELSTPPNWAGLPGAPDATGARQQAIDATYGQAQSRLDPQWSQRAEGLRTQLLNEGLRPGMQAYDQRMQEFERGRTDAYDTAMRSAIMAGEPVAAGEFGRGLQGRQQGIAEMLQRRGSSLNEINALLGGQQVGMPQMPGFAQAGMAQPPDYLGAMSNMYGAQLNQYNAGQAQQQSLQNGTMGMLPYLFML